MKSVALRAAIAAAAVPSMLLLGSAAAAADTPAPVHPAVLLGQNQNPLAAFLACAPAGLIPLFGPNIILPICVV